jgi:Tol biopolymer transport system component
VPYAFADGSLLVVSSDDERNGKHLFTSMILHDTSTRITEGGSDNFPVLSPDGKTVACSSGNADNIFTVGGG